MATIKKYVVDRGCTGCDTCPHLCPVHAISFGLDGASIDQDKCLGCGTCYKNCASEAISEIVIQEPSSKGEQQ